MVAFNKITGLMVAAFAAGTVANPMGWPKFGKDLHVRVYRYESKDCTGPYQGEGFPKGESIQPNLLPQKRPIFSSRRRRLL